MASEYIAPLNLKYIFINVFAGNSDIFLGLFFIAMSVLAGIFKMNGKTFLLMVGLSGILLYGWFGGGFYILIVLIAAALTFWSISRLVK